MHFFLSRSNFGRCSLGLPRMSTWAKLQSCLNSKLPNKGIPVVFSSSLRYIELQSANEGTSKPRGGYRYTVCGHGTPLSGEKYDVTLQNYQTKVYRWILRQFTVHWTKISYWHNKAKRIPIYRLLSRCTSFWQKIRCCSSKLPKGISVDFPPVYDSLNETQLLRA